MLWSDERIGIEAWNYLDVGTVVLTYGQAKNLLAKMRDEYEAELKKIRDSGQDTEVVGKISIRIDRDALGIR
jgi:hypothetical protein